MKSIFEHIKEDPRYSLTSEERMAMRTQLAHRMAQVSREPAGSFVWVAYMMRPTPLIALVLIAGVSLGSVSFVAHGAYPGDVLYGVKVSVNENIELALASSPEAKARTYVRHTKERFTETEVLAVRGTLTQEIALDTVRSVDENVTQALGLAEGLVEAGESEVALDIQEQVASVLFAHGELIGAQAENFTDESREILKNFSETTLAKAGETEGARDEVHETSLARAEVAKEQAYQSLGLFKERIEKARVPEESRNAFAEESVQLEEELAGAQDAFDERNYEEAKRLYERADRRAYRARALIETATTIAQKTDQEVVVVLSVQAPASGARQAKTAESSATLMAMPMATSEDASSTLSLDAVEVTSVLRFELRNEEK